MPSCITIYSLVLRFCNIWELLKTGDREVDIQRGYGIMALLISLVTTLLAVIAGPIGPNHILRFLGIRLGNICLR